MINQTHIVVARRCSPSWYEVVAVFTPPEGDTDYPYMRAAHADAEARSSTSPTQVHAFVLRSQIRVGRQFNLLTEQAVPIDHSALQIAKREILQQLITDKSGGLKTDLKPGAKK